MPKNIDRSTAFTEQQLILKESQLRRVQALKEARAVLGSQMVFASGAVEPEDLIRVAEYILEG